MDARFKKILILGFCGAFLLAVPASASFLDFIFGTPAPTPAPVVSSGGGAPTQVTAMSPDLAIIESLLRSISDQVSLIAENTRPQLKAPVTGNIVLFDTAGDLSHTVTNGTYVVALPEGSCDIAVYGDSLLMYITVEELKDYQSSRYSRNYQTCVDVYLCRRTVTLDDDYSYLYITAKPYDYRNQLTRITLSYRCTSP
jgi:hypothetical protein